MSRTHHAARRGESRRADGHSLVEALLAVALLLVVSATATPSLIGSRDAARARGAAEYLSGQLHLARLEALKTHVNVALRFEPVGGDFQFAWYADGNGNGVRNSEIDAGVDVRVRAPETPGQQFPGVRFAIETGVTDIDSGAALTGEPVQVGRSRMVSFSPVGTSTSGTVYLLGRGHRQFAVRVLGPTGRVRLFEFAVTTRDWRPR